MSADATAAQSGSSSISAAAGASGKENAQSVQLFQRAHQKMVMLQRVEDQLQQLLNQRRSIQDELRGIQVQINEEFERLLKAGAVVPPASAGSSGASRFADISEEGSSRIAIGAPIKPVPMNAMDVWLVLSVMRVPQRPRAEQLAGNAARASAR